jgi:perosamine synthetase
MYTIPIYKPTLAGNEKKYVNECLTSNWISSKGEFVTKFEHCFANYIGISHATSVSNGTVALHLALVALGVGPGDEVIVPTLTYIASVNAIVYTGATPVFVDSLEETWQIDPEDVRKKINHNTKAIMVVHLYGHPCDMDTLCNIAKEHNLFLIEDCAEAFGSLYKKQHVGTFGDISTFSFYGNKTITTGEGGMIVTQDETLYDRTVHYKGQGLAKHRQYWHDVIGYNYRMTNICAAIGLGQLEQADKIIAQKRMLAQWYKKYLNGLELDFHEEHQDCVHSYWMFSILVREAFLRDRLRKELEDLGIETRPVFYPVHTMPIYSHKFQKHRVAEKLGWCGINLPSSPDLSEEQVKFICGKISDFMSKLKRL